LIGTGPFLLGSWKRGQYIDLVRFRRYASLPGPRDGTTGGKTALVDRVRFLIIPDSSVARAALLSGGVDVIAQLPPNELSGIRGDRRVRTSHAAASDIWVIMLQTNDPLLRDVRMRQAIALTIDSAGLTKAITWGVSKPNNSPVSATSPYYGPTQAALRKVDIPKARALARAAGYRGQPIRIVTNRQYPMMFDAAVLVQAMAARAGIKFEIVTVDWANEVDRYAAGNYQTMVFAFSPRLDPAMTFDLFIGDKRGDPRKVWNSASARELLHQAFTVSGAARQPIFDQLHLDFMRDTPAIVLFNSTSTSAIRSNVVGYADWPAQTQRFWGVSLK
jgi:peptide/nickel transport system substrate-binding protein